MKKNEMKTKAMAVAMSATMAASICPAVPAMAVTKDQVAKDGVYTKTAHVTRTEADVDDEWDEYDVEVSLTVKDGKFSDIKVTPGEGYTDENKSYLSKAYERTKGIKTLLLDKEATEDTVNGWDTVSGATRSSTAIKKAALEAIQSAPVAEAPVTVDTSALEKSIEQAKALNESDYTAETWSVLKEKLAAAETAASEKKSQDAVDAAKNELDAAIAGLKKAEVAKEVYVLMNIPYNAFYQADTNSKTDAVSSATLQKTRVSGLAGGSYHVDPEGSDISGVTFPVKISSDALKNYKQVTDDSKVSITTSVKGNTSTTEYTGKDALFESENYSYYILSEEPSYYKEATVEADGTLSFGKVVGTAQTLSDAAGEFSTETRYGDYELDITGLPDSVSKVYGVVVETKEGDKYGLRHLENIWKKTELAWSTGFVTESHGNQLSYENYKAMMGQTINQITYYTDAGIYEIPMNIYVPVKFSGEVKVEDAKLESGETTYTVSGIPDDYEAQYSVKGLKDVKAKDEKLTFDTKDATPGQYTLTISDKSGKYADITTKFLLTTDKVPVSYDAESNGLVPAEKYSQNDADAYVKNISSVTVNGEKYAATGKGSVKIIKEDGTLDTTAKPFADAKDGDKYEITVASTGYTTDYDFTYTVNDQNEYKYVYAGLTWAEYWAAEGVQAAGDASSSDAVDTKGESDKGAFDTVTRATTNHGLHRGSYQCSSVIYMKDGTTYEVAYYPDKDSRTTAVLTNGETVTYNTDDIDHYIVTGLKYVPVKVAAADYEAFAQKYAVVENGSELTGGFSEGNLSSYSGITANVTEETNGLKTATKNEDGSFSFSARETGTESGITGQELKTAPTAEDAGLTVKEANGSYGEFLRVDLTGNYGDLGANMQAVKWTYYGDDSTYSNAKATYGTKFASDNWMHKSMGIQLGLTDSLRCTLPEGTDGTGYWTITISALGYNDVTYQFQATDENIVKPDAGEIDTAKLEAAIAAAEALNKDDYTEASWEAMQVELGEAKEELQAKHSQATVDEATEHLNAAINALEKASEDEYKYVYAGLTWAEYWAAENVQAAGDASSSDAVDTRGESDKGAFDVVTRATTNHGLHRGSYQCSSVIYMKDGSTYSVAYYPEADSRTTAVLTNGETVTYNTDDIDHYIVTGLKYVPVKVAAADYEAFAQKYAVVENGSELTGGFSEGNLSSYSGITANVTENTNGLKTATKNADGSFGFSARETGTESGITGQELKTAPTAEDAGLTVKEANGSYGEFLRVDLTGNYGDLGANMQAVKWTYYGDDSTYSNAKATYGTKFASDNWMHKSMGIQLGLTDSLRCTLPEGTDGTGYWTITISALGYNDVTYQFQATDENIVKPDAGEIDTTKLEAAIAAAEALNKDDYTEASWEAMQVELGEAKEELQAKHSQATVDEATEHLNAAINALEKVEVPAEVDTTKLEASIKAAEGLKESDYTADSWEAMQNALASAKAALEAKESQTAVDSAAEALDSAVAALVKADSEDPVKEVSTDALEKAISTAEGLKESDYTADSWKALQSALTSAKTALAEKKDQTSVDAATENLNKAISVLVKASSTSGSTTTTTGTSVTKTGTTGSKTSGTSTGSNSSTKAAKTGDPAGILGWLGLAVSSLGAGIGGFKLKRRRDEEEK